MSQKALLFCFAALASTFTLQAAETDSDKLYAALRTGNLSELKALLDHGISANAADSRLITPLMNAAIVGSADAMRILIEHGADVKMPKAPLVPRRSCGPGLMHKRCGFCSTIARM